MVILKKIKGIVVSKKKKVRDYLLGRKMLSTKISGAPEQDGMSAKQREYSSKKQAWSKSGMWHTSVPNHRILHKTATLGIGCYIVLAKGANTSRLSHHQHEEATKTLALSPASYSTNQDTEARATLWVSIFLTQERKEQCSHRCFVLGVRLLLLHLLKNDKRWKDITTL